MSDTALTTIALATAAGYELTRIDYGSQADYATPQKGRYVTILKKIHLGTTLHEMEAMGESTVGASTADTNALAALNAQRKNLYGADTDHYNINPDTGSAFTAADG